MNFQVTAEDLEAALGEFADELEHYGVKGMRWGFRRDLRKTARSGRAEFAKAYDQKFLDKQHEDEDEPDLNELFFIYEEDEDGAYDLVDPFGEAEHADLDDELAHYGIKGMKWGVRRKDYVKKSTGSGSNSDATKKKDAGSKVLVKKSSPALAKKEPQGPSQQPKPAAAVAVKTDNVAARTRVNPKRLSDQDLSAAIKRLQMEKQYKDLSAPEINAGRKIATDILINSGKAVATKYVTHYMLQGAAKLTKVDLSKKDKKDKKDQED